jgi:hypothetical protein
MLRPVISGKGRLISAWRPPAELAKSAAAIKGTATNIPMTGKGCPIVSQPAAEAAAAKPAHRPSVAPRASFMVRLASMKTSRLLTMKTIRPAVTTVSMKSSKVSSLEGTVAP